MFKVQSASKPSPIHRRRPQQQPSRLLLFAISFLFLIVNVFSQEVLLRNAGQPSAAAASSSPPNGVPSHQVHAAVRPLLSGSHFSSRTAALTGVSSHGRRLSDAGIFSALLGTGSGSSSSSSTASSASGLLSAGASLLVLPTSLISSTIQPISDTITGGSSTGSSSTGSTSVGSTFQSLLGGLNPSNYAEYYAQVPLVGGLVSSMAGLTGSTGSTSYGSSASSSSSAGGLLSSAGGVLSSGLSSATSAVSSATSSTSVASLSSIVEGLLGARELNTNLFGGLSDSLAAFAVVPLLGVSADQQPSSATSLDSVGVNSLFGVGDLLRTISAEGVSVLSSFDASSLQGASADSAGNGGVFKSAFGNLNVADDLISGLAVDSSTDEQMIAEAELGRQQMSVGLDYSTSIAGQLNSLLTLFSGGSIMPTSLGLLGLQEAVQQLLQAPTTSSNWEGIISCLSSLRLDVISLPKAFLLSTEQTTTSAQGVSIIDQLLSLIKGNGSEITLPFLTQFQSLLTSLGQNFLELDGTTTSPLAFVNGIDVTKSIVGISSTNGSEVVNNNFSVFSFNLGSAIPSLGSGFGFDSQVIIELMGTGASLGIHGVTTGIKAFASILERFVSGAVTGATVLRSLVTTVFLTIPSMFLDAVAQESVLGTIQRNVETSLVVVSSTSASSAVSSIGTALGNSLSEASSTDYLEKLFSGATGGTSDSSDSLLGILKLLGLQNCRSDSSNLSSVLGQQSSSVSTIFQLPASLLTEFFSNGLNTALNVAGLMFGGSGGLLGSSLLSIFSNFVSSGTSSSSSTTSSSSSTTSSGTSSSSGLSALSLLNPLSLLSASPSRTTTTINVVPLGDASVLSLLGLSSRRRLQEATAAAAAAAVAGASGGSSTAATSAPEIPPVVAEVTTHVVDVEGVTLKTAAGGVSTLWTVIGQLAAATLAKPCEAEALAVGNTLLNAAVVAGDPNKVLEAVGVSTDQISAAVTLDPDTVAAAAVPTNAELEDPAFQLCEEKAKAVAKLASVAAAQADLYAHIEQLSLTTDISEARALDKLLETSDCVVPSTV